MLVIGSDRVVPVRPPCCRKPARMCVVEEERHLHVDSSPGHSLTQMEEKWRCGGLTAALGKSQGDLH